MTLKLKQKRNVILVSINVHTMYLWIIIFIY